MNEPHPDDHSVTAVLDSLLRAGADGRISLRQVVGQLGERTFAPVLLIPAMILVSPISSIPGMPTMGALVMALVTVQMLLGRRHLWLPERLAQRSMSLDRLERAVAYLRKPARWIDRHIHRRFTYLARRPLSYIALLTCLAVTMVMPLMEFVPALATVAAFAITLFAIGLMTLDGAFIIAGYVFVGLGVLLAAALI